MSALHLRYRQFNRQSLTIIPSMAVEVELCCPRRLQSLLAAHLEMQARRYCVRYKNATYSKLLCPVLGNAAAQEC